MRYERLLGRYSGILTKQNDESMNATPFLQPKMQTTYAENA